MPYLSLRGIDTFYEQHGHGDPVLLLHGGDCSNETWAAQIAALSEQFRVHAPERPGHGRTPDRVGPFGFDDMVADTIAYLDAIDISSAHIVGFSDGAITGLLMAIRHPERVRSLVSIGANIHPDAFGDVPAASAEDMASFREAYARLSPDGPGHAPVVSGKLAAMWKSEPDISPAELARITAPTLVMAGQYDCVRIDHTLTIAAAIPGAQLCIVPGAGHLLCQQRPGLATLVIAEFLTGPAVAGPPRP